MGLPSLILTAQENKGPQMPLTLLAVHPMVTHLMAMMMDLMISTLSGQCSHSCPKLLTASLRTLPPAILLSLHQTPHVEQKSVSWISLMDLTHRSFGCSSCN